MRSTTRWMSVSLLTLALLSLPIVASAQDRDPTGTWEGFSSSGNFVVITLSANEGGGFAAETTVYEGGLAGTPATETYNVAATQVDPGHTQFDVDGELGTLHGHWYSDDALRLHVSPDVIVSLARLHDPASSALAGGQPTAEEPDEGGGE